MKSCAFGVYFHRIRVGERQILRKKCPFSNKYRNAEYVRTGPQFVEHYPVEQEPRVRSQAR